MDKSSPKVSIVIPVRNEAALLGSCLESIHAMNLPEGQVEILVVDGLSTDGTAALAREKGAIVVENPRMTVAPARNLGVQNAKGEVVAFTDADCQVFPDWIENALRLLEDPTLGGCGGPNFTPPEESGFGKAVGYVMGQAIFAAGSCQARNFERPRQVTTLPGCNAVYKKIALTQALPTDESLLTCDDTRMNRDILDKGWKLLFAPDVRVWHWRRPKPKSLFRQFYRYAIGRLQAGRKDHRLFHFMHWLVGFGIPLALAWIVIWAFVAPMVLLGTVGVALVLLVGLLAHAVYALRDIRASLQVPVVAGLIAISWSLGWLREFINPLKQTAGR